MIEGSDSWLYFWTCFRWACQAHEFQSCNLVYQRSCLLMVFLAFGTPEWTNLELSDGQVGRRSNGYSSQLDRRPNSSSASGSISGRHVNLNHPAPDHGSRPLTSLAGIRSITLLNLPEGRNSSSSTRITLHRNAGCSFLNLGPMIDSKSRSTPCSGMILTVT